MNKKRIIAMIVVGVVGLVLLVLAISLWRTLTGIPFPTWAIFVGALIWALAIYMAFLLTKSSKVQFDDLLAQRNFHADSSYAWGQYVLHMDFAARCLASNYLSTKQLVPFDDIIGYRVEAYRKGTLVVLPETERYLSLVITVRKEGYDSEYLYISVFEIKVDAALLNDELTVTDEMVAACGELDQLVRLQRDLDRAMGKSN